MNYVNRFSTRTTKTSSSYIDNLYINIPMNCINITVTEFSVSDYAAVIQSYISSNYKSHSRINSHVMKQNFSCLNIMYFIYLFTYRNMPILRIPCSKFPTKNSYFVLQKLYNKLTKYFNNITCQAAFKNQLKQITTSQAYYNVTEYLQDLRD